MLLKVTGFDFANFNFSAIEGNFLFKVAKLAIKKGFKNKTHLSDKEIEAEIPENISIHSPVFKNLGVFVTINLNKKLRGCIGSIVSSDPLVYGVAKMAYAAAFQDNRFNPLSQSEYEKATLEISVLSALTQCPGTNKIELGRHGLLIQNKGKQAIFLPQVPIEQRWTLQDYLQNLCLKAGLPNNSYLEPSAKLYWYEAKVLDEQKYDIYF